mmetsp:Transcript_102418/g.184737  ORF Transcript_102418/g.184737 Transcript_102418/m.184737 type:complete len:106 (-) Transcript_102418:285-602(-)
MPEAFARATARAFKDGACRCCQQKARFIPGSSHKWTMTRGAHKREWGCHCWELLRANVRSGRGDNCAATVVRERKSNLAFRVGGRMAAGQQTRLKERGPPHERLC